MAIEAPMGIGDIYGPIKPETKAIGSTEAMTVNVANIVGLPTSLIAYKAACFKWQTLHFKMPMHVLCNNNRVVYHNSSYKNQGK
jgi:hypothetical protein